MKKNLMKLVLCIMVLSIFLIVPASVNAKTNKEINIKKTFVRGVCEKISSKKYDKNQDGYLSKKEIKQIKELYLYSTYENFNLKGLSKLKDLEKIKIEPMYYICNVREFKKLRNLKYVKIRMKTKRKKVFDFTKNKKLKTLNIEMTRQKSVVKVRKNNAISELSLWGIKNSIAIANKCSKVKTLHLGKNGDKGYLNIVDRKNLEKVYLYTNIKGVSIRNCNNLKEVEIAKKRIERCTIENNSKLQFIKIYGGKISNLTIKNLKKLRKIYIHDVKIYNFLMDGLSELRTITMYDVKGLTDLTISNFSKLWNIEVCRVPDLQSFTVENLKNLKQMSCIAGKVTELNIVGDHKLKEVEVYKNRLKTFAYDNLKDVSYLDISNNQIEGRFDFTLYPKLYRFDCSNNRISEIYGGPLNRVIDYIDCYNNNMKLLHFTELDKYAGYIFYVNCKKNPNIEVHAWMEDYDSDPTANIPYH